LVRRLKAPAFAERARQLDLRAHNREQAVVVPRLRNEIARATLHRLHRQIDGGPRRHDHDRERVIQRLDFWNYLQPFLPRSRVSGVIQVHDQERVILFFERLKDARERRHRIRLVPLPLEQNAQRLQHIVLVVGD
jgi:hypothetical protein